MQLPFNLPDWAPPWVAFALIVVGGLLMLAFLLMPFSVFGLKGRLEGVEARLDEIQGEIRSLALRLPEPASRTEYAGGEKPRSWEDSPPIPPRRAAADYPQADRPPPSPTRRVDPRGPRAEPRFDPR